MLNLLTSAQMREADSYTIRHKPISSIDLMECASKAFTVIFTNEFPQLETRISIYCGTGNNGGDGLAIARLLKERGYRNISVRIIRFTNKTSPDFEINLRRLSDILLTEVIGAEFPEENAEIIIDAILGSGLNKPLEGNWKLLADHLNALNKPVVAVDIPTGLPAEGVIDVNAAVVKADLVITFQRPKINFFFPESQDAVTRFQVADIGLDESYIQSQETGWKLVTEDDIRKVLKPRKQFSHKGTYGHSLIIAGRKETMGAALLSVEACLHTGSGLTTACIPEEGLVSLNTRCPEVMALIRDKDFNLPEIRKYTTVAAGPGLGADGVSETLINDLLTGFSKPMVLDADALNILAENKKWLVRLPENSVLTPHLKEFDRLFGEHRSFSHRIETAKEQASKLNVCIVLKNRYTFIVSPDQQVFINQTGSPAMATGGMGDVLTGMVTAFIAQGYKPLQACLLAVYIHGLCGQYEGYVCTASALIKNIPGMIEGLMPK